MSPLSDDVCKMILDNAKSGARHYGNINKISDIDELESFLISELTKSLMNNPNMRNIAGIRHIISKRWNNWVKRDVIIRQKHEISIQHMMNKTSDKLDSPKEIDVTSIISVSKDVIGDQIESYDLYAFLNTLSEKERKVIELTAGFTDSLEEDELHGVQDLIDSKAVCSCGEPECQHSVKVWFTESEVGKVLSLSRRQVQYITGRESKVRERAYDFGLRP